MSREKLKVSWGFGKGVNLTSYIRVMTWTGMFISSAMFVLTLNILVLPSALHLSMREMIGKISFELALVSLPIGLERDFPFRTIDTNPVVYADIVITMMLPSVGWFFYNLYLRKAVINCNYWMDVEDFIKKGTTVAAFYFNVLNLVSIAVTETLKIDWLVNKMLTSSANVTSIVWIILSILNAIFSSTLLYGIRRRKAHIIKIYLGWANSLLVIWVLAVLLFSCVFVVTFAMPWIVALAIPLINISIFLFVLCVGNVVILYSIIIGERVNALEMRESVNAQPQPVSPGVIFSSESSNGQPERNVGQFDRNNEGRRLRNTIRIVDDTCNVSEVVAEIAGAIDSFS